MLEHYQRHSKSLTTQCRDKRPFCRRYRMICLKSSLIRQLYHFAIDLDRVLLQLLGNDIENSLLKWLTVMIETFDLLMKSYKKFNLIFNVQLHVHFKKWTLKFKLLYLRNYISYLNKICRIRCVNAHIQSLKVWLKSVLPWLKYSICPRGLFFIGAPCISSCGLRLDNEAVRIKAGLQLGLSL